MTATKKKQNTSSPNRFLKRAYLMHFLRFVVVFFVIVGLALSVFGFTSGVSAGGV